ncbi:MAG: phosphotransferase [Ruminococcus sp.]|nr:phosphotransferase [Ruminococcus sp.]
MNFDRVIALRNTKTIYRDGDNCIKVFNQDYTSADVLNEAFNQAMASESGLSVPKVKAVTETDGKWSITSEYIAGKSLAQLMAEFPDKINEYLNMFVDLQLKIHSKRCPTLKRLRDQMNRKIKKSGLDATDRFALHTRIDSMPKHNKLLHGDFNPSNVIISGEGIPYVIDWAHAVQGNASSDVAITYLTLMLGWDSEIADKYIEMFCQKSGTDSDYVRKWFPIASVAIADKRNGTEKDFLLEFAEKSINNRR